MYNKIEDYLKDDDFIKYILGESNEWDYASKETIDNISLYDEAKQIILAPADIDTDLSSKECEELKMQIFSMLGLEIQQ